MMEPSTQAMARGTRWGRLQLVVINRSAGVATTTATPASWSCLLPLLIPLDGCRHLRSLIRMWAST